MDLHIIKSKSVRAGKPTITFGAKGLITISSAAVNAIGIKDGQSVALAYDKKRDQDWYLIIYKEEEPSSPNIRDIKKGKETASFAFNCSSYTQSFMDRFGGGDGSVKVPLATVGEPILEGKAMAYAVITKALNN